MLREFFLTGIQLTQVLGLCILLWGAGVTFLALTGNRGPGDLVKGAALLLFGVYLAGLGQGL